MISSSIDHQLRFHQFFWFLVIVISALFCGYLLAANALLMAVGVMAFMWAISLPYHSKLSVYLSVATFSSALIVPLFPGRPFLWEFAALLGWSGLVVTISMRQYSKDAARLFVANRWLFVAVIGYSLVLMITMMYRGVGLRILGSDQMGGRYYFQQLSCAIFPFIFVLCPPKEGTLVRLFVCQCLLTGTYLVSDFILTRAPAALFFLLQFFELSGDAINFEMKAERFGIRRFQSFYMVSSGLFFLLLVRYKLREFLAGRALLLIPAMLLILGLGTLSGHRYLALVLGGVLALTAYAQRFFTFKNTLVGLAVFLLALSLTYAAAERLPLAVQRAVSFVPGIDIHMQAKIDADGTLDVRRTLRKIGMDMAPRYFWIGRGFGIAPVDYSWQWDPTTVTGHVNQGRFFNGFVGLLVNTGIFGTAFMLLFLTIGSALAWRILQYVRRYGSEDAFVRMCTVISGLWIINAIGFLFLHGDSEYAMKTFSLQAGMLIVCYEHLKARLKAAQRE